MIATIATIAEIELKSISAIVVAAIAELLYFSTTGYQSLKL